MAAQMPVVTCPTNTTATSSYPQLDLGPLAQPLLTRVSRAQSRGIQASVLLNTCALITHNLAKSEKGLSSMFSTLLPLRTEASQALLPASLGHHLDPGGALGAVSLPTCLDTGARELSH